MIVYRDLHSLLGIGSLTLEENLRIQIDEEDHSTVHECHLQKKTACISLKVQVMTFPNIYS